MKRGIWAALAVGGVLVLGGCGAESPASTTSVPANIPTMSDTPSAAPSATKTGPTVKKRTITKNRTIPFITRRVNDPTLAKGITRVRTRGVAGRKILIYRVTFTNGAQSRKRLLRTKIIRVPVTRVIAVGTKKTPQCDPNYSGACVPIASDVDCAGGSGNGPAYVQGPVRVVGRDIYGLDADGDGIGCDS
jgi:resuscitation-promoting factor RpfB